MDVKAMRQVLKKRYPGAIWEQKVDRMSDKQIIAVHSRFIKLDTKEKS